MKKIFYLVTFEHLDWNSSIKSLSLIVATLPVTPIIRFIWPQRGFPSADKQLSRMDCTAYNVANNTGVDILYVNFNQDYR